MASIIYSKALEDAQLWMRNRIENIEIDYFVLYCNTNKSEY